MLACNSKEDKVYNALFADFQTWAIKNNWFCYFSQISSTIEGGMFYEYYTPIGNMVFLRVNKDGRIEPTKSNYRKEV